jgi:hypothetical protein
VVQGNGGHESARRFSGLGIRMLLAHAHKVIDYLGRDVCFGSILLKNYFWDQSEQY